MEKTQPKNLEPQKWQSFSTWLQPFADINHEENQARFGEALLGTTTREEMPMDRVSLGLSNLMDVSKSWDKFSIPFTNEEHAEKFLNTVMELEERDEKLAIRALDIVFGRRRQSGTEILEVLGNIDDSNFKSFINELKFDDSILLSDDEMNKLNSPRTSGDASKRPVRYILAGLFNGSAGVRGVKGNLQKSIDFCKKKYLHI